MAGVTWHLSLAALVDPLTITLAILSAILLLRFHVRSTWLILIGIVVGILKAAIWRQGLMDVNQFLTKP